MCEFLILFNCKRFLKWVPEDFRGPLKPVTTALKPIWGPKNLFSGFGQFCRFRILQNSHFGHILDFGFSFSGVGF